MEQHFSYKDLYSATLCATQQIKIGNRTIEEGEVIARFDKISLAAMQEDKKITSANGGFDNRAHVIWETTKEMPFAFSQGVFSKTQFALMTNSYLIEVAQNTQSLISYTEELESNASKKIILKNMPVKDIFVYNKSTGAKLEYTIENNEITIGTAFTEVIVDYKFNYLGGGQLYKIGHSLLNGFVSFEGKTKIKDDNTGQIRTGIIRIPKLKLTSGLSIALGSDTNPVIANFSGIGIPVDSRGNSYVSEVFYLNNDIDSDL